MSLAKDEYSLQYWGFTPLQFFQEFGTVILDEMSVIFHERILKLSSDSQNSVNSELLRETMEMHQTWCARTETALNAVQPTIEDFFTIPKNVLLPGEGWLKQFSEAEVADLQLEVQRLEEQYAKEMEAAELMEKELAILVKLEPLHKKVEDGLEEVKKFEAKLNEIRELEKVAQDFQGAKKSLSRDTKDDGEDSNNYDFAAVYFHGSNNC